MPNSKRGGYSWRAELLDGRWIRQYDEQGTETPIEVLRGLDLKTVVLRPLNRSVSVPITIDVASGLDWAKFYMRGRNIIGGASEDAFNPVDMLALHHDEGVHFFVFDDGAILISANENAFLNYL